MKYLVWTLFVWVPVIVIAAVAHAVDTVASCSNPNGCFVPRIGDIAVILLPLVAVPLWVIGLVAVWWWNRTGHPSSRRQP